MPNEVVLEFAGNLRRRRSLIWRGATASRGSNSVSFALTNSTYFRARISDGRPVRAVLAGLAARQRCAPASRTISISWRSPAPRIAGRDLRAA